MGNPVYASNNDYIMAFDFVNAYGNVYLIGANLETGDLGTITNNNTSLGFPSFSNDDSKVIYQYYDGYQYTLWVVGLQNDKINGAANDSLFAYDGKSPVWFAVGKRPSDVDDQEENESVPSDFVLDQNYPNPFNPTTTIRFQLKSLNTTKPLRVNLSIFNILGQKVKTLMDQYQLPGRYEVAWDGKNDVQEDVASGLYFYRLSTNESTVTKKMVLLR